LFATDRSRCHVTLRRRRRCRSACAALGRRAACTRCKTGPSTRKAMTWWTAAICPGQGEIEGRRGRSDMEYMDGNVGCVTRGDVRQGAPTITGRAGDEGERAARSNDWTLWFTSRREDGHMAFPAAILRRSARWYAWSAKDGYGARRRRTSTTAPTLGSRSIGRSRGLAVCHARGDRQREGAQGNSVNRRATGRPEVGDRPSAARQRPRQGPTESRRKAAWGARSSVSAEERQH